MRPAPALQGILESVLYARDLERAEAFYGGVIGLELVTREQGRHVFFKCGPGMLLIFNPEVTAHHTTTVGSADIPLHGARGAGHLAFAVSERELQPWREHLRTHDVEIESEVEWPNGATSLYFRDPDENSLELATPQLWFPA